MPEIARTNLWALDKHSTIKHLLLRLQQDMGEETFNVLDAERLHTQSIRIGAEQTPATAYLYTYGQAAQRYGVHLEYPYNEESNTSELEEIYEELRYNQLLEIVKLHLL
jgi:hypothetical protein